MMTRCTCDDPKVEVCEIHQTFKINWFKWELMCLKSDINTKWCQFKWWVAKLILGELFYDTAFICPKCETHFCPAKDKGLK